MTGSCEEVSELGLNIPPLVLDLASVCTFLMEVSPIPTIFRQG